MFAYILQIYRDEIEQQLSLVVNGLKKGSNDRSNENDDDGDDNDEDDNNNECSFWVDLLDREEEDRRYQQSLDAVLLGLSASSLSPTPTSPTAAGGATSSSDLSTLPATPSHSVPSSAPFSPSLLSPRSKAQAPVTATGAIHIACRRINSNTSVQDGEGGSKELHGLGRQSSFRASTAAAAGATTIGGGATAAAGSNPDHGLGGRDERRKSESWLRFLIRMPAFLWPWVVRGVFWCAFVQLVYRAWGYFLWPYFGSPSGLVENFATFESELYEVLAKYAVTLELHHCHSCTQREGALFSFFVLVENHAEKYLGHMTSQRRDLSHMYVCSHSLSISSFMQVRARLVEAMHLRSPLRILMALITCATAKLQVLLHSSEASALLAQPLALCGGSAYIAAHAGFLLGAPLIELLMSAVGLFLRVTNLHQWLGVSDLSGNDELESTNQSKKQIELKGMKDSSSSLDANGNGKGNSEDEFVASGDVERWELTLIGWELASAAALNRALLAKKKKEDDNDDDNDSNASEPNAEAAAPFLPERFLLAEAGDYAKGLQR